MKSLLNVETLGEALTMMDKVNKVMQEEETGLHAVEAGIPQDRINNTKSALEVAFGCSAYGISQVAAILAGPGPVIPLYTTRCPVHGVSKNIAFARYDSLEPDALPTLVDWSGRETDLNAQRLKGQNPPGDLATLTRMLVTGRAVRLNFAQASLLLCTAEDDSGEEMTPEQEAEFGAMLDRMAETHNRIAAEYAAKKAAAEMA